MSNLTAYKSNNGIEIFIDTTTGESFCSIRGYARMSGLDHSTIVKRISRSGDKIATKTAEILTPAGVRSGALLNEDTITEWLPKDAPDVATQFMKIGVRMFLHQLAGYSVVSTAVVNPVENLSRRQLLEMALEAEIQLEAAQQEIDTLVEKVVELEPRAIAWDNIAHVDGLIRLNDFAGALGMGRTTLTRKLVAMKIMFTDSIGMGKRRNRAYAQHVRAGYFVEKMTDIKDYRGEFVYDEFTTLITKTGAEWLVKKLAKVQ